MPEQYHTNPEDKVSWLHRFVYGIGAFVNNLLAAAIGNMMMVLNLGLGMNPALVGTLGAIPRFIDALTDPLMGYISDHTKSRWGRRRPYIFIGAIIAGVTFALLWQLPRGMSENFYFWFFLIGSLFFYVGYTIFATPWVALGYELTPDYHERTRLMGTQNFMGLFAYIVTPWFLAIMTLPNFEDMVEGASYLAITIGVVAIALGVLPAIYLKERFANPITSKPVTEPQPSQPSQISLWAGAIHNAKAFFEGFAITLKMKPFLLLCLATFLVFNGFMLVASFQSYSLIYYVFGGDTEAASKYIGLSGSIGAASSFLVIVFVVWLAAKIGKRQAFFIAMSVAVVGHLLKWWTYSPETPWLILLTEPLRAFGLGALFTLMGSMMADVCDLDELNTHERREGMFGSIFWWVVKLGMALAIFLSGVLLNVTGFDVALEGNQTEETLFLLRLFDVVIPIMANLIAIWAVRKFPITEEKAHEIRSQLEARRSQSVPVS